MVLTEMLFPSVVTFMYIHDRGLEESKKAQELVCIKERCKMYQLLSTYL